MAIFLTNLKLKQFGEGVVQGTNIDSNRRRNNKDNQSQFNYLLLLGPGYLGEFKPNLF